MLLIPDLNPKDRFCLHANVLLAITTASHEPGAENPSGSTLSRQEPVDAPVFDQGARLCVVNS